MKKSALNMFIDFERTIRYIDIAIVKKPNTVRAILQIWNKKYIHVFPLISLSVNIYLHFYKII